jgi:hypothetical protein
MSSFPLLFSALSGFALFDHAPPLDALVPYCAFHLLFQRNQRLGWIRLQTFNVYRHS